MLHSGQVPEGTWVDGGSPGGVEVAVASLRQLPPGELAALLAEGAAESPRLRARVIAALAAIEDRPYASDIERSVPASPAPDEFMIGASAPMLGVFDRVRRFAAVDAAVLVTGESGTGKELVARAIHQRSARANGPFVAINCAALPSSLIAAELFGHEKGAFTGATERRPGHIELAHGGTLFLDEIGDLPIEVQGHLLRFLQDGQVTRIGSRRPVRVDARIVSATHVPLQEAMSTRRFREDLYYRLAVLTLELPPLRARGGDLELLASVFLQRISTEFGRKVHGFEPAALEAMRTYSWPGNVRQLIAVIRRAVVMGNEPVIRLGDLALEPAQASAAAILPAPKHVRPRPGSEEERRLLQEALDANSQSVTRAARTLGVSRVTLYRMMERNGLSPKR